MRSGTTVILSLACRPWCGHDTINTLNKAGYPQRVANNLYDDAKQTELASSNWTFARKKAQLAKLTTGPIDEFESAYQLPADLLKLLKVSPGGKYKLYGDQLFTNQSGEIFITYTANVPESAFTPAFTKMFQYALAYDYGIPIREGFSVSQLQEQRYITARRRATQIDSSQEPQDRIRSNPFIAARFGGGRGIGA